MKRPLRIGLTGGIASGKSTVAQLFAAFDVPVIDTDVIARELVEPGSPALEQIRAAFGDEFLLPDGRLNRRSLRQHVFADPNRRKLLESILHPRIRAETIARSEAADGRYQIIVVPLLVESPLRKLVDRVLVVDCSEDTQLRRLLERDAGNEDQARRMIAAQASRSERLAIADDVLRNDADLGAVRNQVGALHEKYLSLVDPAD